MVHGLTFWWFMVVSHPILHTPFSEIRIYSVHIFRIPLSWECGSRELPLPSNAGVENMTYSKPICVFYPLITIIGSDQSIPTTVHSGTSLRFCGRRLFLLLDFEIWGNLELSRGPCVETQSQPGANTVERRAQRWTEKEAEFWLHCLNLKSCPSWKPLIFQL